MNSSTAYNHYTRLSSRIQSIHSTTRISCRDHMDHIASIKEQVWDDPAMKKLPRHYQTALHELESVLFKDIQQNWVVWMFINSKGKQVFWEELTDEERQNYCNKDRTGKHYWLRLKVMHGRTQYDSKAMTAKREYEITSREW